jgi:hypothetical protein
LPSCALANLALAVANLTHEEGKGGANAEGLALREAPMGHFAPTVPTQAPSLIAS